MITHKDIQMKFVGVLLITFSIFFPLLKIVSSLGYYYNYHRARENPVIKFFVLKSGKWSMADVMVVAMFMTYIGFNGIITNQLGQLSSSVQELEILTTNGTPFSRGITCSLHTPCWRYFIRIPNQKTSHFQKSMNDRSTFPKT